MRVDPVPNWVAAAGTGGENPQENGNGCERRGRKRTQNEDVNQNINLCEAVEGERGSERSEEEDQGSEEEPFWERHYKKLNQSINQSINQSFISGLFHCILLPDHRWQINEINQGQR